MDWEGCSVHRWLVVFWTGLVDWTHCLTAASRDRQGAMSLRTPSHNHNTFIPSFRVFVPYHSSSVIVINSRRSRLHVSFVIVCHYDWPSKKKKKCFKKRKRTHSAFSVSLLTAVAFISISVRLAHLQRCRGSLGLWPVCRIMPVHTMLEWDDKLFDGNDMSEVVECFSHVGDDERVLNMFFH